MVDFKIKYHKHPCRYGCGSFVTCRETILHDTSCDDCHAKKVDELFF